MGVEPTGLLLSRAAKGKFILTVKAPGSYRFSVVHDVRTNRITSYNVCYTKLLRIGSHDTHRVASLLGDPKLVDVAFGMLAAYPGVPMLYAGDEIGLASYNFV